MDGEVTDVENNEGDRGEVEILGAWPQESKQVRV